MMSDFNDDAPLYDDVILAYQAFRGPLPEPGPPIRFTIRQRSRIWRTRKREQIEQWIHDHLHNARCDC